MIKIEGVVSVNFKEYIRNSCRVYIIFVGSIEDLTKSLCISNFHIELVMWVGSIEDLTKSLCISNFHIELVM